MQVAPQPEEPVVVSEQPTQHFSPELGLGTAASNVADVVDALTVGGLLDLIPGSEPRYVGVKGAETPVCAEEPVVDVVGVDRKLFDAANAAKARTHFCWGMPGSLAGVSYDPLAMISQPQGFLGGFAEDLCCVPPWVCTHLSLYVLFCTCSVLGNTLCCRHEDMEFPPWAGAALVMTDKGVIGRRHMRPDKTPEKQAKQQASYARFNEEVPPHARDVNAISWSGFDVDRNVRIRSYDTPRCTSACDPMIPLSNSWDPLVVGPYFGLVVPCCRCICIQPKEPGLYRARIQSTHKTGPQSTGSIDLLALARSPDDLRSSLRAVKEKYLESLPTTTVEHDFGVWCGRLGISTFRSDTGRAEVGSVKTCSKAESYGMQVGDTVLELDGQRVDHDAFRAGLAAARRAKRTVRLLIARAGRLG
jgi:hypothetical protein